MDIAGKVVLITGAKRIGSSVAAALARQGADISIAYNRSAKEAERAAALVRDAGRSGLIYTGRRHERRRLPTSDRRDRLWSGATRRADQHGVEVRIEAARRAGETAWDRALAVDLKGPYLCALAAVPHLRAGGWRPDHQLFRLGGPQRPAEVSGGSSRTT